jgi:hypothetical protein
MTHLSSDHVVDVVEGCADAARTSHAASCDACRAKVEALREAVRLAESDPLPEPSPLFWPRLAARIGEAVRREPNRMPSWRMWAWRLAPIGAAAVFVMAIGIGSRVSSSDPGAGSPGAAPVAPALFEASPGTESAEDPSWTLVSELSSDVSVEEADAHGELLPGGTEKALLQLDSAERVELARILRQELGARAAAVPQGPGA